MSADDRERWSHLRATWDPRIPVASESAVHTAMAQRPDIAVPDADGPLEQTIGMLNTAAGIEHALMVEYLYAAGSLEDWDAAQVIAGIAVEEMGHLLSVQNLLMALGAEPCFGRQDLDPNPADDPFPYRLRPGTPDVIASFVATESPVAAELNPFARLELKGIVAHADTGNRKVNRVAVIYDRLRTRMTSPRAADWFVAARSELRQATAEEEWAHGGSERDLIVRRVNCVADAVALIDAISAQGEGFANCANSHFERFRRVYRGMRLSHFVPSALLGSARSPSGRLPALWRALGLYGGRVSQRAYGRAGAPGTDLFNTRYRIVLLFLLETLERQVTDRRRAPLIEILMREMALVLPALLRWVRENELARGEAEVFLLPTDPPSNAVDRRRQLAIDLGLSRQQSNVLGSVDKSQFVSSILAEIATLDEQRLSLTASPPDMAAPHD